MQFGTVFTYAESSQDQMPRMKYLKCKLLQDVSEYPKGSAIDQIWFDTLTGDLWLIPDAKCHWDITDNFPVKL